jgi:uncharacterized membrane protein
MVTASSADRTLPHWWWTPLRVLLALTTLTFMLALLHRAPCIAEDWSGSARYAAMCYSDIPYLYTGRGFAELAWPYTEGRYPGMEYPVVISYVAFAVAALVSLAPQGPAMELRSLSDPDQLWGMAGMVDEVNQYFVLTSVVLFLAALASTALLSGVHRGRPWDALPFAVSPMLLLTGLINWDLLAVLCVAAALWAWSRTEGAARPLLTGALIGLGTATKLYPLFLLGAVLVINLRERRHRETALAVLSAVAVWAVAQVPAWMGDRDRWTLFWTFNSDRGADLGSIWLAAQPLGYSFSAHQINQASWFLFGLACVGVLVLGLRAPRAPRMAQLGFLIVAAFLLVNKVYSPQYVLWLLPLAVMARPRWRDLLVWQAGELVYFASVWLYLGEWLGDAAGDGSTAYSLAILIRLAAQAYLMAVVVRDVWSGDDDLVDVGGREPAADADLVAHGGDRG